MTTTAALTRHTIGMYGAFGALTLGALELVTCERAFPVDDTPGTWFTKIPPGTYTCVRGMHQLAHGVPFSTFEITGVVGHSGLLFHPGNTYLDSIGCVLVGTSNGKLMDRSQIGVTVPAILGSIAAFSRFMSALDGIDSFTLGVTDDY